MMTSTRTPTTHVYRVSLHNPRYRIALAFLVVVGLLLVIGLVAARYMAGAVGGAVAFVIALTHHIVTDTRVTLTISLDGIEYRTPQRAIVANWHDVERIGRLRNPLQRWQIGDGLWLVGYRVTAGLPSAWRLADAFVPLAWFAPNWRNSPLGDDIRQYAPSLFVDTAESRQ